MKLLAHKKSERWVAIKLRKRKQALKRAKAAQETYGHENPYALDEEDLGEERECDKREAPLMPVKTRAFIRVDDLCANAFFAFGQCNSPWRRRLH